MFYVKWNRKEMEKITRSVPIQTPKIKKAVLLQKNSDKFKFVSINDLQQMMQTMRDHRKKNEFEYWYSERLDVPSKITKNIVYKPKTKRSKAQIWQNKALNLQTTNSILKKQLNDIKMENKRIDIEYKRKIKELESDCFTFIKNIEDDIQTKIEDIIIKYELILKDLQSIHNQKISMMQREHYQNIFEVEQKYKCMINEYENKSQSKVNILSQLQDVNFCQTVEYRQIVKNVIQKAYDNDDGQSLSLQLGGKYPTKYVRCKTFGNPEGDGHGLKTIRDHIPYLNNFISITCKSDDKLEKRLVSEFAKSEKWNPLIKSTLNIAKKLNKKETIKHYINSLQAVRKWQDSNADLNRKLGIKTMFSMDVINKEKHIQSMKSSIYFEADLEVSKKSDDPEINNNKQRKKKKQTEYVLEKFIIFNCKSEEQWVRTVEMELIQHGIVYNYSFGVKTVIGTEGMDKYGDGITVSLMTCTRSEKNNAPLKRRDIAYCGRNKNGNVAAETTNNLRVIYKNMRNGLELLKENTSLLIIRMDPTINDYHVCALRCDYKNKQRLGISLYNYLQIMNMINSNFSEKGEMLFTRVSCSEQLFPLFAKIRIHPNSQWH